MVGLCGLQSESCPSRADVDSESMALYCTGLGMVAMA